MFRALDQLSGDHRPSQFFAANKAADEQIVELAALREQLQQLAGHVQRLIMQADAVRELHTRLTLRSVPGRSLCHHCETPWPCSTIRALDGVQAP
jgi:hypothetical protein